jgi:cytoskeleton protein RodZ
MSEQIENELPAEQDVIAQIPSVGSVLRKAREAKGLPIADIAQTLKLGHRQIEALERDDWSGLPGTTFIRGFVRNYARLLDVDAVPLMHSLDSLLAKPVDTLAVSETVPAPMSSSGQSRDGLVVGIGAVILVLAALAYFLLPNDLNVLRSSLQSLIDGNSQQSTTLERQELPAASQSAQEPLFPPGTSGQQLIAPNLATATSGSDSPTTPASSVAAPAPASEAVTKAPPATETLPVKLAASSTGASQLRFNIVQESWLEVRDQAGTIVFSQRLPAGSEQAVTGKGPLSVTIGFAPGVRLNANGKTIDLAPHTKGDVARLVLE